MAGLAVAGSVFNTALKVHRDGVQGQNDFQDKLTTGALGKITQRVNNVKELKVPDTLPQSILNLMKRPNVSTAEKRQIAALLGGAALLYKIYDPNGFTMEKTSELAYSAFESTIGLSQERLGAMVTSLVASAAMPSSMFELWGLVPKASPVLALGNFLTGDEYANNYTQIALSAGLGSAVATYAPSIINGLSVGVVAHAAAPIGVYTAYNHFRSVETNDIVNGNDITIGEKPIEGGFESLLNITGAHKTIEITDDTTINEIRSFFNKHKEAIQNEYYRQSIGTRLFDVLVNFEKTKNPYRKAILDQLKNDTNVAIKGQLGHEILDHGDSLSQSLDNFGRELQIKTLPKTSAILTKVQIIDQDNDGDERTGTTEHQIKYTFGTNKTLIPPRGVDGGTQRPKIDHASVYIAEDNNRVMQKRGYFFNLKADEGKTYRVLYESDFSVYNNKNMAKPFNPENIVILDSSTVPNDYLGAPNEYLGATAIDIDLAKATPFSGGDDPVEEKGDNGEYFRVRIADHIMRKGLDDMMLQITQFPYVFNAPTFSEESNYLHYFRGTSTTAKMNTVVAFSSTTYMDCSYKNNFYDGTLDNFDSFDDPFNGEEFGRFEQSLPGAVTYLAEAIGLVISYYLARFNILDTEEETEILSTDNMKISWFDSSSELRKKTTVQEMRQALGKSPSELKITTTPFKKDYIKKFSTSFLMANGSNYFTRLIIKKLKDMRTPDDFKRLVDSIENEEIVDELRTSEEREDAIQILRQNKRSLKLKYSSNKFLQDFIKKKFYTIADDIRKCADTGKYIPLDQPHVVFKPGENQGPTRYYAAAYFIRDIEEFGRIQGVHPDVRFEPDGKNDEEIERLNELLQRIRYNGQDGASNEQYIINDLSGKTHDEKMKWLADKGLLNDMGNRSWIKTVLNFMVNYWRTILVSMAIVFVVSQYGWKADNTALPGPTVVQPSLQNNPPPPDTSLRTHDTSPDSTISQFTNLRPGPLVQNFPKDRDQFTIIKTQQKNGFLKTNGGGEAAVFGEGTRGKVTATQIENVMNLVGGSPVIFSLNGKTFLRQGNEYGEVEFGPQIESDSNIQEQSQNETTALMSVGNSLPEQTSKNVVLTLTPTNIDNKDLDKALANSVLTTIDKSKEKIEQDIKTFEGHLVEAQASYSNISILLQVPEDFKGDGGGRSDGIKINGKQLFAIGENGSLQQWINTTFPRNYSSTDGWLKPKLKGPLNLAIVPVTTSTGKNYMDYDDDVVTSIEKYIYAWDQFWIQPATFNSVIYNSTIKGMTNPFAKVMSDIGLNPFEELVDVSLRDVFLGRLVYGRNHESGLYKTKYSELPQAVVKYLKPLRRDLIRIRAELRRANLNDTMKQVEALNKLDEMLSTSHEENDTSISKIDYSIFAFLSLGYNPFMGALYLLLKNFDPDIVRDSMTTNNPPSPNNALL